MIGAGLVAVIVGGAGGAGTSYVADFGRPGEDCGSGRVHFDQSNGEVLRCAPGGGASVSFPGFTEGQNEQIEALAEELGADILSEADEVQIQRIDEFAATVPESARPQPLGLGPLRGRRAGLDRRCPDRCRPTRPGPSRPPQLDLVDIADGRPASTQPAPW